MWSTTTSGSPRRTLMFEVLGAVAGESGVAMELTLGVRRGSPAVARRDLYRSVTGAECDCSAASPLCEGGFVQTHARGGGQIQRFGQAVDRQAERQIGELQRLLIESSRLVPEEP